MSKQICDKTLSFARSLNHFFSKTHFAFDYHHGEQNSTREHPSFTTRERIGIQRELPERESFATDSGEGNKSGASFSKRSTWNFNSWSHENTTPTHDNGGQEVHGQGCV
jgi:hypothetical protein